MLDLTHYLLRPLLLRRVKGEVEQTLPAKLETLIGCPLSDMQTHFTRALLLKEHALIQRFAGVRPAAQTTEKGSK